MAPPEAPLERAHGGASIAAEAPSRPPVGQQSSSLQPPPTCPARIRVRRLSRHSPGGGATRAEEPLTSRVKPGRRPSVAGCGKPASDISCAPSNAASTKPRPPEDPIRPGLSLRWANGCFVAPSCPIRRAPIPLPRMVNQLRARRIHAMYPQSRPRFSNAVLVALIPVLDPSAPLARLAASSPSSSPCDPTRALGLGIWSSPTARQRGWMGCGARQGGSRACT